MKKKVKSKQALAQVVKKPQARFAHIPVSLSAELIKERRRQD